MQLGSVFRVLEPVIENINEKVKAQPSIGSRFGLRSQFRVHRVRLHISLHSLWYRAFYFQDFSLPLESHDVLFLKTRIAIMCSKGFEIMDPVGSVTSSHGGWMPLLTPTQFQECCYPVQERSAIGETFKEMGVV